jgi:RNA binding exosome subunit
LRSAIGHFGDTISTTTARTHMSDTAEFRIDIARKVAETEKFVAEQRKLIAEERKLHAEADKFGRERLTLVVSSTAAATLGIAAVGGLIVKLLGW